MVMNRCKIIMDSMTWGKRQFMTSVVNFMSWQKSTFRMINVVNEYVLGCCERQTGSEFAGVGHGRVRMFVVDYLLHVLPLQNHTHLELIDRQVEITPDLVVKT